VQLTALFTQVFCRFSISTLKRKRFPVFHTNNVKRIFSAKSFSLLGKVNGGDERLSGELEGTCALDAAGGCWKFFLFFLATSKFATLRLLIYNPHLTIISRSS